MKGIILAGGSGTRLAPMTSIISKQLLPVYDKPMICYPLSTLLLLGIQELLIISTTQDLPHIERYFGNGSQLGLNISYAEQDQPNGIAEALIIGENFLNGESCALILGDNIFYMSGLFQELHPHTQLTEGAVILTYQVADPQRFGVASFDKDKNVTALEEKPANPQSNHAVVGLYFYDGQASKYAKNLQRSDRGELEITDLNKIYLEKQILKAHPLSRGTAWIDAGTPQALLEASTFIGTVEHRQSLKIACIEEIVYRKGFIDSQQMDALINQFKDGSDYKRYLIDIKNQIEQE